MNNLGDLRSACSSLTILRFKLLLYKWFFWSSFLSWAATHHVQAPVIFLWFHVWPTTQKILISPSTYFVVHLRIQSMSLKATIECACYISIGELPCNNIIIGSPELDLKKNLIVSQYLKSINLPNFESRANNSTPSLPRFPQSFIPHHTHTFLCDQLVPYWS
jgi:hypothetical protein